MFFMPQLLAFMRECCMLRRLVFGAAIRNPVTNPKDAEGLAEATHNAEPTKLTAVDFGPLSINHVQDAPMQWTKRCKARSQHFPIHPTPPNLPLNHLQPPAAP